MTAFCLLVGRTMSNSDSKFSLSDGDGDARRTKKIMKKNNDEEQSCCGLRNNCPFITANYITFEVQGLHYDVHHDVVFLLISTTVDSVA